MKSSQKSISGGIANTQAAAKFLIQKFREGYFGRMTLETLPDLLE
jgi:hypothetical protein